VIEHPYLMFLGDAPDQLAAKTAQGVVHWREGWCIGQLRLEGCQADVGLPDLSIAEAAAGGARTMVIGVANQGGYLPEHWVDSICEALEAGLDVANGLHIRLTDIDRVRRTAEAEGRRLFDVRHPTRTFKTGNGAKRRGRRLLAVGTDCSCGKMYTALAFEAEMRRRGMKADFRATGQTGILIAGEGVSVDAVIADFIAGATEWLTPENDDDHWDCVEGQGSLFHPAYAGVSLGLLHGAQPDAIILCHEPTRQHMRGLPHFALPSLEDCLDLNLRTGRLTNPAIRCVGIAVNTAALSPDEAEAYLHGVENDMGMPAVDPFRDGVARLVDRL